jgi:hypothetical protein
VTAELNIHLEDPVSTKTVRSELHKSIFIVRLQLLNLWLLKSNAQMCKRWCHDHITWTSDNWKSARYGHMSRPSRCSLHQEELTLGERPRKPKSRMPGSNTETRVRFCDGLCSNIVVQYSVGPIIILHGRITAREYVDRLGNQVHPMIQTLFPNNGAVFQDDNAPFTQLELFSHGVRSEEWGRHSRLRL